MIWILKGRMKEIIYWGNLGLHHCKWFSPQTLLLSVARSREIWWKCWKEVFCVTYNSPTLFLVYACCQGQGWLVLKTNFLLLSPLSYNHCAPNGLHFSTLSQLPPFLCCLFLSSDSHLHHHWLGYWYHFFIVWSSWYCNIPSPLLKKGITFCCLAVIFFLSLRCSNQSNSTATKSQREKLGIVCGFPVLNFVRQAPKNFCIAFHLSYQAYSMIVPVSLAIQMPYWWLDGGAFLFFWLPAWQFSFWYFSYKDKKPCNTTASYAMQ